MNLQPFINNTIEGLNNPECAFFVGSLFSLVSFSYYILEIIKYGIIAYVVIKVTKYIIDYLKYRQEENKKNGWYTNG